ncbi:FxLYD domain-containing protein [Romboutsia sp. 1001713B170131_170501_G6]|uniref:FxLYD domain-containing protein n=1 Tax=Romboutsia sp. 1001713B170131_170501_G6 TaxID=2787108 RepID=UPI0018AA8890|nr:FxLYD domain-containing protein [Romboutsia sp. 1001713B170131_170501_G6]
MKKVLLGVIIGFVVIIGGCAVMLAQGASSVNNAIEETQSQSKKENKKIEEMAKNITWEIKKEDYMTKIVGVFENTSDEKIDYVQFDYKLLGKDGTVIEKSFTNETDIAPGEKRKIEILCAKDDFASYEVTATNSAF